MSAVDRMADGYEPRWDLDAAVGRQGELFIARIVDAIKDDAGIEVKTDARAPQTGNVYLERRCLHHGEWRKSGLATTSAELWAHVIGEQVAVVAPTELFRQAGRRAWENPRLRANLDRGSHPTQGLLVPLPNLLGWLTSSGD